LTPIPNIGIFEKNIEMSKNTSVTLGEHFEQIIEKSIKSGRYSSASEVIREGLRLVDEREQKIKVLREAIEAGEKSGYVKNFDPIKHLEKLNQRYKK
jgi:antitoxin ParD1/3/4